MESEQPVQVEQELPVPESITEPQASEDPTYTESVLGTGKLIEAYTSQYENDISLPKDELVFIWEMENESWWRVQSQTTGETGYVPASYVELVEDFRMELHSEDQTLEMDRTIPPYEELVPISTETITTLDAQ